MEILFFFLFFSTFSCFFIYFHKKLYALLVLEALMIFLIFSFFSFVSCGSSVHFFMLSFSVMMVLESIFGICLLILCGRSGSVTHPLFNFL